MSVRREKSSAARNSSDGRIILRHEVRLGKLRVVIIAGDESLYRIYVEPDRGTAEEYISVPSGVNPPILACVRYLDAYSKREKSLLPPIDISSFSDNEKRIYETLLNTHAGETIAYGELALRAGFPRAARFAGQCMRKNSYPLIIPCHRVIPASGGICNYTPGPHIKRYLLDFESGDIDIASRG
jgi:methylated-DNA-[protein]-cysteine S-methyltransferase